MRMNMNMKKRSVTGIQLSTCPVLDMIGRSCKACACNRRGITVGGVVRRAEASCKSSAWDHDGCQAVRLSGCLARWMDGAQKQRVNECVYVACMCAWCRRGDKGKKRAKREERERERVSILFFRLSIPC